MTVGENIRRIRKEKGLTQKQLGDLCGIKDANIRKYEINPTITPQLKTIEKIATALEVKVTDLYDIDETDITETRFAKACEYLEDAGFSVDPPDINDGLQQYFINSSNRGTICKMDKITLIETIQPLIDKANSIRDDILVGYIQKAIIDEP